MRLPEIDSDPDSDTDFEYEYEGGEEEPRMTQMGAEVCAGVSRDTSLG